MTKLIRYNSIDLFHTLAEKVASTAEYYKVSLPTVTFKGTVKANGTNRSVVFYGPGRDERQYQTRETIIEVGNKHSDHYGFGSYIEGNPAALDQLTRIALKARLLTGNMTSPVQIYGEWVGKGISGKVGNAVEHLPGNHFIVFGVRVSDSNEERDYINLNQVWYDGDPRIRSVEEFPKFFVTVDFSNPEPALEEINKLTFQVEENCPIGAYLNPGCEYTIGEGLVWEAIDYTWKPIEVQDTVPLNPGWKLKDLVFKTKGSKHKKGKRTYVALADPQKVANVEAMAKLALDGRLEQGLEFLKASGHELTKENFRLYVAWLIQDIEREEAGTLKASNLVIGDITGIIGRTANKFYMERWRAVINGGIPYEYINRV